MTEQELREKIKGHIDAIATIAAKQGYYSDAEAQETTAAIMDLIKPKELVWSGSGYRISAIAFGVMDFYWINGNEFSCRLHSAGDVDYIHENQSKAKAAAQAHYNSMFYDMMGAGK